MSGLMKGKRGLIMGVANDHSIAWGIARTLAGQGATLAFSYQGEALGRRVKPLADSIGASFVLPCDVEQVQSLDATFAAIAEKWGSLDFLVHAIAFSDKNELKGRYADTTRENFTRTMLISCFSFTEVAKRAAALMPAGGAMLTLTYNGGLRVMPNYNVMGVAKAALEASVRYLAADFGPAAIRVNAISAGPIRTLAGARLAAGLLGLGLLFRLEVFAGFLIDDLHRQAHLAALIEPEQLDLHPVAFLDHVGDLLDPARRQLADVHQAVLRSEEVHERAEIDDLHDGTVVNVADFRLRRDRLDPVDRRLDRFGVGGRDLDHAVVGNVDLGAGLLDDLADDLA